MSGLSDQQWADFTMADIGPPTSLEQLITFLEKWDCFAWYKICIDNLSKAKVEPFNQTIFYVKIKHMPDSLYVVYSGYSKLQ